MNWKFFFMVCIATCSATIMLAQKPNYTGIWTGRFYSNTSFGMVADDYRFEVQIAQSGNGFEGVTYSYLSTTFYGKASHNGYLKTDGKRLVIQETRLIEVKSMSGGACLMTCLLNYGKQGDEEYLEGTFTARDVKDGSPCEGGFVKLKKVQKSFFKVDTKVQEKLNEIAKSKLKLTPKPKPLLVKVNPKPLIAKANPNPNSTPKPQPKPVPKTIIAKVTPKPTPPVVKVTTLPKPKIVPAVETTAVPKKVKIDTAKPAIVVNIAKPLPPVPAIIKERSNELVQTISVPDTAQHIIKFYDYGEIDGDVVSIYLNNKLIVSSKKLDVQPIEIPISLSPSLTEITITMIAESMGTIPPCTAFMVVYIAGKRYEAKIESNTQKNAVVKFVYLK